MLVTMCLCVMPILSPASESNLSADLPVVILFDRSYSMTDLLHGQPKIKIAKHAFRDLAQRFHGQIQVSVRFFAGGRNEQDEAANCVASEQSFPMGKRVDATAVDGLVSGLRPLGRKTNIAFAIEQATKDLAGFERGRIILISDGQENCEQDPIALPRRWQIKISR